MIITEIRYKLHIKFVLNKIQFPVKAGHRPGNKSLPEPTMAQLLDEYESIEGCFKNVYEFLKLTALKFSPANKMHIFQCMGKIFVGFQRVPLKFHTKYLTHTLKDAIFIQRAILRALRFKSS